MPTLQGRESEQGEAGMEQTAGRERKMRELRAPQAQHRHTELSLPLESHPSFPAWGWSRAGGKLGHCQAAVPVPVPGPGHSSSWTHPALLLSCDMAKGSHEVPPGAAGMRNKVSPFSDQCFYQFLSFEDLKFP